MTDDLFRQEVKAFIAAELPRDMAARTLLGYHPHRPDVEFWTAKLHARGWSAMSWPVEYGGPGWTLNQRHIFEEECFIAGCPAVNPQAFALVGPIIYALGTEAQKQRFLPPILQGTHFWAQGFSEPNSGSDLASLKTRAIRDGDEYVVNGQKIWTSEAHYCDWIFLLVRTSTEGKPQAGISFLLADLKSPGITIRPIIGIDGGHILNEVFLEDVRVPAENLIGEENKGWTYAKQLLGAERTHSAEVPRCKGLLARAKAVAAAITARGRPLIDNPHFARRLAQLEIEILAHDLEILNAIFKRYYEEFTRYDSDKTIRGTKAMVPIDCADLASDLGVDADIFNLLNSNAPNAYIFASGPTYRYSTGVNGGILPARTGRIGLHYTF